LAVELVSSQLSAEPGSATGAALLAATHEALRWVAAAKARRVVIRAISRPDGVQVTVRGHGDGPESNGRPSDHIGQELRRVGGRVETWSAPGRGTRVTLWAPA
jgi:nitrate/nitrite-specific signal transduction histidine kinase